MPNFVFLDLVFQVLLYHAVKGEPSRFGVPEPCTLQRKLALGTRGMSPVSLELSCLVRVFCTWGLEPCHVVYANSVIYGGDLGPCNVNLTSGVAGDRVTKVSHPVLCSCVAKPQ